MKLIKSYFVVALFFASLGIVQFASAQDNVPLRGINMAGAEFNGKKIPGKLFKDYIFPSDEDIKKYADFGFELIRLPFKWERLQPALNGPFDQDYLQEITRVVKEAEKYDVYVLLDVHNYGRYKGKLIGSPQVPAESFNNLWFKIATYFGGYDNAMFGIMNEPNKHNAEEWFPIAQGALTSIRQAGATQTVMVPSTLWSNAHRFLKKDGDYSNAELLKNIKDPENNFVYEVHTYFDSDNSGTHDNCPAGDNIGIKRLNRITKWLQNNNKQAFLGEFGVSTDETCLKVLDKTLAFMDENSDAWFGWSYWAGAKWFGDYMFNIYPPDTDTSPQAAILKKYIPK